MKKYLGVVCFLLAGLCFLTVLTGCAVAEEEKPQVIIEVIESTEVSEDLEEPEYRRVEVTSTASGKNGNAWVEAVILDCVTNNLLSQEGYCSIMDLPDLAFIIERDGNQYLYAEEASSVWFLYVLEDHVFPQEGDVVLWGEEEEIARLVEAPLYEVTSGAGFVPGEGTSKMTQFSEEPIKGYEARAWVRIESSDSAVNPMYWVQDLAGSNGSYVLFRRWR